MKRLAVVLVTLLVATAAARADIPVSPGEAADAPPHKLDGKPILGTSLGFGTVRAVRDSAIFINDGWLGLGLTDHAAIFAFGQLGIASYESRGSHAALGGGLRLWPFAGVPAISVEGRVGFAVRDSDHPSSDRDPILLAGFGGGAVVLDLARRPVFGLELRGTVQTLVSQGRGDLIAFIAIGGSLY
jgi:hypothetical protein